MNPPPLPSPPAPPVPTTVARSLVRPSAHYLTPSPLPVFLVSPSSSISFYHPGYSTVSKGDIADALPNGSDYEDSDALIFCLPAVDNGGIHLGTALAACLVIACNRSGFLTRFTPGGERIVLPWDSVLPTGIRYYYQLDASPPTLLYPICTSFQTWKFTRSVIPAEWVLAFAPTRATSSLTLNPIVAPSQMSLGVRSRDIICRITAARDATESAHIIPRKELPWFHRNTMRTYNSNPAAAKDTTRVIDDVRNGLLLRQDLHSTFDRAVFCLAVKEGVVVPHFLEPTYELGALYHNTTFRLPAADPCVEFVWARFAWSIIPLAASFDANPARRASALVTVTVANPAPTAAKRRSKRPAAPKAEKRARAPEFPQEELPEEVEEDRHTKEEFFPDMGALQEALSLVVLGPVADHGGIGEDVLYSEDYTWQTAPFYPGQRRSERLKLWWRDRNPQVGPVKRSRRGGKVEK